MKEDKTNKRLRLWCIIVGCIDFVLLLLLLLLPSTCNRIALFGGQEYRVLVRDARTGQAIEGAKISSSLLVVDERDSITVLTNGNGYAEMPFREPTDSVLDMYVTKEGYGGQRIYHEKVGDIFNPDKVLVVELGLPMECSDQIQDNMNRDKGMHNVEDYEMGQNGGTFVFEYFTDTLPDEIIVYDGPSSTMDQNQVLFRYHGASNTSVFTRQLNFTSRVVTVVVNGGTNWYYIVHCPRE